MAQVPVTSLMSIDSCSVARIQDQGGNALVSPSLGPPFVVAGSTADALAGLINGAGEGTLLVELPTVVGTQWVAAQHVNTTMQQADGTVRLQLAGAQTVVVSGMSLAAVQAALNACARCGGGGGGGTVENGTPVLTITSENPDVTITQILESGYTRIVNRLFLHFFFAYESVAGAAAPFNINVAGLPFPPLPWSDDPPGGFVNLAAQSPLFAQAEYVDDTNLRLIIRSTIAPNGAGAGFYQFVYDIDTAPPPELLEAETDEPLMLALQAESESLTPEVTDEPAPFDALDAGPDLPAPEAPKAPNDAPPKKKGKR